MIEFDCPECGESMQTNDGKAGQRVRCVGCDAKVTVPKRGQRRRGPAGPAPIFGANEFTWAEYLIYGSALFVLPCVGLIGVVIAHTFWREDKPTKAYQLAQLAGGVLCLHALFFCLLCGLGAMLNRGRGPRASIDASEKNAIVRS